MSGPRRLPQDDPPGPFSAPAPNAFRSRGNTTAPDLVANVIQQAIARRASDIHFDPTETGMLVRFRVDGLLQHGGDIPAEAPGPVTSRIRSRGDMDISEHPLPPAV